MIPFLEWAVGAIVWALANLIYADMRRRGAHGFGRLAAFWVGQPTTWLSLFFVREGHAERFNPPPDDDDRLLREVRVDRELRARGARPQVGGGAGSGRESPPRV